MTLHCRPLLLRFLLLAGLLCCAFEAHAEPYLAVQTGFKCGQCHVNPTGGGQRTVFGNTFAQTQLAAKRLEAGPELWTGEVTKFLSVGGDLRYDATYTQVPRTSSTNQFELDQMRVYATASVIPNRLIVYVDEQVAPGGALNREAYGTYWSANHDWYVKAGQMYLPFGFRLQDQTAFVKQVSGINMTTPDQGVEAGLERGNWDAQIDVSNGTAAGPVVNHGKQYGTQLMYVQQVWRVGIAGNFNDAAAGSKTAAGLFGGIRTGPIAWLAEVDYVNDRSQSNLVTGAGLKELATLIEGNWRITKGHNLKITGEFLDPNRDVANDGRTRWSIVYELSPVQFVQFRAGFRYYDGIPQDPSQHEKLTFLELHGFF